MKTLLEITELRIYPKDSNGQKITGIIANATMYLNDTIWISGIKIMKDRKECVNIKFPSNFHMISPEDKRNFENRILATYVINHCVDGYNL